MKSLTLAIAATLLAASVACSNSTAKEPDALAIPTGSDVTLEKRDGTKEPLPGRVQFRAETGDVLVVETPGGGGWGKAE